MRYVVAIELVLIRPSPGDIVDGINFRGEAMADLLVRRVDEAIVRALEERAGKHGRSAEAEHRAILTSALARPPKRSFAEVLVSMPEVGVDEDFERLSGQVASFVDFMQASPLVGLDEDLVFERDASLTRKFQV